MSHSGGALTRTGCAGHSPRVTHRPPALGVAVPLLAPRGYPTVVRVLTHPDTPQSSRRQWQRIGLDPTTPRLAAWWWNPKSRNARLAALDAAQEVGYTRTSTGAGYDMRDAAEHQASAEQAALERLEREEGLDLPRIRNSETEPEIKPDDEWDFGR